MSENVVHPWLKGTVKAVLSGDTMVVMGSDKNGPPPEKIIKLAGIQAPKLGGRNRTEEPFAWESRESLRKKCVGKVVSFKLEFVLPRRSIEICIVALSTPVSTLNMAFDVIKDGWAFVLPPGLLTPNQMIEIQWAALIQEEAKAQRNALGIWNMKLQAREAAIRQLPPRAMGSQSTFDVVGFFNANKGRPLPAIVEHVRDGNTIHVYFLPGFHYIQIFVAGIKVPPMGISAPIHEPSSTSEALNRSGGDTQISEESLKPPEKLATRNVAASCLQVAHEPFQQQAKHFTEVNVLNRDVIITLTGVHKSRSLIGSVHYAKHTFTVDLASELVKKGLATLLNWSVNMMDEEPRHVLQAAELQARKDKIGFWYNYAPRPSNSIAIVDLHFSGKVAEIVSGDCIMVLEDDNPCGSPQVERRVYLSSIRAPRLRKGRMGERVASYGPEAKEFLRSKLIGKQVNVTMEYSCKLPQIRPDVDARSMEFGSVHLISSYIMRDALQISGLECHPIGINVAEMVLLQGLATVVKHGDLEDRSKFYDKLVAAEHQARQAKKGMHSEKAKPASQASTPIIRAKNVFSHLSGSRRTRAIVDYVFNGQNFILLIPKVGGEINFCLSGIQCPAYGQPFFDEASTFVRQKIMQREVEIEVQNFQSFSRTFLGLLWAGELNVSIELLKAGLAKLHPRFNPDWTTEGELMVHSERLAKNQQLKIWEGFMRVNTAMENKITYAMKLKQEVHKICMTVVLGGAKFYGRIMGDASSQGLLQELENFEVEKLPLGATFSPKKGDLVLAHDRGTNSWNRALVVDVQQQPESREEEFEVFFIDWGTQDFIQLSEMRPAPKSLWAAPGLARLYCLVDVIVPEIDNKNGLEEAKHLFELIDGKDLVASVEKQVQVGDQVTGQGTGPCLMIRLFTADGNSNINDLMVKRRMDEGMTKSEMLHS